MCFRGGNTLPSKEQGVARIGPIADRETESSIKGNINSRKQPRDETRSGYRSGEESERARKRGWPGDEIKIKRATSLHRAAFISTVCLTRRINQRPRHQTKLFYINDTALFVSRSQFITSTGGGWGEILLFSMSYLSTVKRKRESEREGGVLYLSTLEKRCSRWREEKLVAEDETWRARKRGKEKGGGMAGFFSIKPSFPVSLSLAFEPRCPPDSRLLRSFLNGGSSGIDGSHSIYNRASVRTAQLLT